MKPIELDKFLSIHGNKSRLAREIGVTKGAITQWGECPVKRVPDVEKVTGIPRHVLRPDFFNAPQGAAA